VNAERRKRIADCIAKLADIHNEIEQLATDEQDALDNLPESLQASERGDAMQEAVDALEQAASEVDDAKTTLESIP
jgi:prefoldin subunit 5